MIRKVILGLIGLIVIGAIGFFVFAPTIFERSVNRVESPPVESDVSQTSASSNPDAATEADRAMNRVSADFLPPVSDEALALHKSLTIVDLHADTLLWKRNLLEDVDWGHVDLGRLQQGNVALQVFSSVTKTPEDMNYDGNSGDTDQVTALVIGQLQPMRTWNSLLERSLYHAEKLVNASDGSDGELRTVRSASDLRSLKSARHGGKPTVGGLFSVEGLHNLEGDIANLDKLYAAGMRMAGLTHFFDNEIAGSAHGVEKGGLTDLGREAVAKMEDMGVIIDLAHCSNACIAEVLTIARRPVVSSHGGVQGTCPGNRNLTDNQIRGIAATGGVIGIGYWEGAVCDTSPAAIVRAMKYVRGLVGIDHIALGSDYDGTVLVRFDTSGLAHITQALMDAGFSEVEIRKVMGENALRVIEAGIEPLAAAEEAP